MEGLSRREILGTAVSLTVLGVTAGVTGSLGGCGLIQEKEIPPQVTTGVVNVGPAKDFPAGGANTKFWELYGIVLTNDSGTVLAVRPRCTHKGCLATWQADHQRFGCPCHGSQFDMLGKVLKGPAVRNLPSVVAEKQPDGTLAVDLTKLYAAESALGFKPKG